MILEPNNETIGTRLKLARSSKRLTIPEVSRETGISKGNLSTIENDKTKPSADALIKLSKLYGISTDWILFGNQNGKNEKKNDGISVSVPSLELAGYFSRIGELWERGDEETKAWVVVQLRRAFPEVEKKGRKK